MNALITCKQVGFGYESHDAVAEVSMEVYPGDYLAILGENGSGKSTLMKGLLGFLKPSRGEIILNESLRQSGVGYLPQQTASQRDFPASVEEVVLSGCLSKLNGRPFYGKKEKMLVKQNLERMGIEQLRRHSYKTLSGGQQQRVLIARALCATSRVLILDEPVAGLDPVGIEELYRIVKSLNEEDNIAILMVSHDLGNVLTQANKVLHLNKDVLFYGTIEDYKKSKVGNHFFRGDRAWS